MFKIYVKCVFQNEYRISLHMSFLHKIKTKDFHDLSGSRLLLNDSSKDSTVLEKRIKNYIPYSLTENYSTNKLRIHKRQIFIIRYSKIHVSRENREIIFIHSQFS